MLTARMFSSAKNTFIFKASLYCVSCGVYAFVASNDSTSLVVCQSFFANFFNFFFSGFLPPLFLSTLHFFRHQFVSISRILSYSIRFTGACIP